MLALFVSSEGAELPIWSKGEMSHFEGGQHLPRPFPGSGLGQQVPHMSKTPGGQSGFGVKGEWGYGDKEGAAHTGDLHIWNLKVRVRAKEPSSPLPSHSCWPLASFALAAASGLFLGA